MRRSADILWAVLGQSVSLLVRQGRPTSTTFEVFRNYSDDDGAVEFSGTATIDTPNTTTSAAAGPSQTDPQKLTLVSTSGISVERKLLLTQSSIKEWVHPIEVTASYIRVRHPLENDYTSGATVQSTWISAAIDNTWILDRNTLSDLSDQSIDYRVRWAITVGGATVIAYTFFDVVRQLVEHSVDIDDVNDRTPGLRDSLPVEYQAEEGRPLVDAAWRSVRAHFASVNIDVRALRDDEVLDELVILRARRMLAEGGWHPPDVDWGAFAELVIGDYNRFFEQHFSVSLKHDLQYQLAGASAAYGQPAYGSPTKFWSK